MNNFYCDKKSHGGYYSIDEWNRIIDSVIEDNYDEEIIQFIREKKPCEKQCSDCVKIVEQTRKKNALIRAKQRTEIRLTIKNKLLLVYMGTVITTRTRDPKKFETALMFNSIEFIKRLIEKRDQLIDQHEIDQYNEVIKIIMEKLLEKVNSKNSNQ